jgi:putative heme-binding domain-containing protein
MASGAESDEVVTYQLAFTLGEISGPRKSEALSAIIRRYPQHPWMRVAAFSSLAEDAGGVLAELSADAAFRKTASGKKWLGELAKQIGKQQRPDDVAALLQTLRNLAAAGASEPGAKETLTTIVQSLGVAPTSSLGQQVAAATGGQSEKLLKAMLAEAARRAVDESLAVEKRVEAIHLLSLGGWSAVAPAAETLLRPDQPDPVQAAIVRAMQSFSEMQVADLLLDRWPSLTPKLRIDAAETLFSRPAWLPRALAAVEDGRIAASDLQAGRLQTLASHSDEKIAARARRILEQSQSGRRPEIVEQYRSALAAQGDVERGRAVFRKVCATCHQAEGVGHAIGPNLAAMQARGPEAILVNVLDPNREVNPLYLTYAVITKDGRSLTGMLAGDTATSVTLKRAENLGDTVLRIDIEEMRSMGVSLMPEGLEKQIDVQGMTDLLTYLQAIK